MELGEVFTEPLTIICEESGRSGEVPEDWERASIVPIFKKNEEDPRNCRAVSLIVIYKKILAHVMKQSIKRTEVIWNSQHGLIKSQLCLAKLFSCFDKVTGFVDGGEQWM